MGRSWLVPESIHDKQLRACGAERSMPLSVVAHLIAHPRCKRELATILQFRVQLAFQAQQDMPSPAPVIGQITRTVFNHPHTRRTKLTGSPIGSARLSGVVDRSESRPIGRTKGNIR